MAPLAFDGPGPQMVMENPLKVVPMPQPVPYPVPVPVHVMPPGGYSTLPPRPMMMPAALPAIGYPTMNGGGRKGPRSMYDGAVYQTQPPAYPNGPNFEAALSAF